MLEGQNKPNVKFFCLLAIYNTEQGGVFRDYNEMHEKQACRFKDRIFKMIYYNILPGQLKIFDIF